MQGATPGSLPQVSPSSIIRSASGQMRVDMGTTSMITDPTAMKTIVLDHVKKEALTIPMPQGPQVTPPGMPSFPNAPVPPQVMELGKAVIDGHEVEGKQYTFQPPNLPKPPQLPQMPGLPKAPGAPAMPQGPQAPQAPPMPTVAQVWTSIKTKLPVLTTITGPFGQQVCQCKTAPAPPPPPTTFQIPPDYKSVTALTPPKLPSLQTPKIQTPDIGLPR